MISKKFRCMYMWRFLGHCLADCYTQLHVPKFCWNFILLWSVKVIIPRDLWMGYCIICDSWFRQLINRDSVIRGGIYTPQVYYVNVMTHVMDLKGGGEGQLGGGIIFYYISSYNNKWLFCYLRTGKSIFGDKL